MNKKVNILGKGIPVFAIVILGMALVSAALLPYFGVITGNAVVSQSVLLNGDEYSDPITGAWDGDLVAGESVIDCNGDDAGYSVRNNAGIEAPIELQTICKNASEQEALETAMSIDWDGVCEGIDTEIYGILELSSKDSSDWSETGMKATLYYTVVGDEFAYDLEATGLETSTEYMLIYYADKPDRFVEWGGNPARNLGTATTDSEGNLQLSSSLGMSSLPYEDDWNTGKYANTTGGYADYCESDGYEHCVGAKIWLIPSADYTSDNGRDGYLHAWNPSNYLFETDLIQYSEDTSNVMNLLANGGGFNFCVQQDFALNLVPDTYTIETGIQPETV